MHIYFVNQYSKIVGPFDITDSNLQKNIRNGDVIIRDTSDGLCFLIVTSSINKWNRCKCIDTVQGHLKREGNFLLFSFDGISKRFGDIQALTELCQLFQNPPCHDFFENALSILTYKCDLWDLSIFKDIHSLTPFEIYDNTDKSIVTEKKTYSQYLFEDYFDTNLHSMFLKLIEQNIPLRDVYIKIRRHYPKEFRFALISFIRDHPNSTIYDKIKKS